MVATETELASLEKRRSIIYDGGVSATSYLQDLLGAQQRLAFAEQDYLRSLVTYNVAQVSLERAKGTLLSSAGMHIVSYEDDAGLPSYRFDITKQ